MRQAIIACVAVLCLAASASAGTARASLSVRIPAAKLTNVSLADAIEFLRDVGDVNINVDWKTLQAVNITRDALINLNLHDVRLGKVLSLVLSQAGPGDLLTYYVDDNVVEVTTMAMADQKLVTSVYYVDDLLCANQPFDPTLTGLNSTSTTGTAGTSSNPFSGGATSSNTNNTNTKDAMAAKLIKLIETVIRPEIWKDNGGVATIEYFNGNLIVSAPRSVQEAIGG